MEIDSVTIDSTENWQIDQIGKGDNVCYEIWHGEDDSIFLTGRGAIEFKEYYDKMYECYIDSTSEYYHNTWDYCLSVICEQYFLDEEF
jgi:hypothetical protein